MNPYAEAFSGSPLVTAAGQWDSMKTVCFMNFPQRGQQEAAAATCELWLWVSPFHWASVSPGVRTTFGLSTQQTALCRIGSKVLINSEELLSQSAWMSGAER